MLPRARVVDEKARVELQLWVCCVSARIGRLAKRRYRGTAR